MVDETRIQSEAEIAAQALLNNDDAREIIAVSDRTDNDLTTDEGFANDLRNMPYDQLVSTYGEEVANNRVRLSNTVSDVDRIAERDRSADEVALDWFTSATAAAVRGVANTSGRWIAGLDSMRQGGSYAEGAASMTEFGDEFGNFILDQRSETIQDRERLIGIEAQLDTDDNRRVRDAAVEAGESPFWADIHMAGSNFLDGLDRAANDPGVAGETVAAGIGSLIPSAALASSGAGLFGAGAGLLTTSQRGLLVARATGSALGIGASEASGTYAETVSEIMDMPLETLQEQPAFQNMLDQGLDEKSARLQYAGIIGEQAFLRNLPSAAIIGLISARFEANPIGNFIGASSVRGVRDIMLQGVEETAQAIAGQVTQNTTLDDLDGRSLAQGVGEEAASGLIGGLGQASVSATPAAAVRAAQGILDSVGPAYQVATEGASNIVNAAGQGVSVAREAANSLVESTREVVTPMAENLRTNQEKKAEASDNAAAVDKVFELGNTVIAASQRGGTIEGLGVAEIQQVQRAAESLENGEGDPVAAVQQFQVLEGRLDQMSPEQRMLAKEFLDSPMVKRAKEEATKVDQNTETPITEVTPENTQATIDLARINPGNVNPENVTKILEESGQNLTPEAVEDLQVSSDVASILNERHAGEVEILNDKDHQIALKNNRTPQVTKTPENVSRSIQIDGYTDKKGRQLRSVGQFARDIMIGAKAPDGKVINAEKQTVRVQQVAKQFHNLVKHLNNKVGALNESFDSNDRSGRGQEISYEGLDGANNFVAAGEFNNRVFYHRADANSVANARQVHADAVTAARVFERMAQAHPEVFSGLGPIQIQPLKQNGTPHEVLNLDALNAEIDAQEAAEIQPDERRIRKDAVVKTEESLIDYNDSDPIADVVESLVQEPQGDTTETSETIEPLTESGEQETQNDNSPTIDEDTAAAVSEEQSQGEITTEEPALQIDGDDIIRDDNGNVVDFYHGTNALFTEFRDGGIFLTTRKGLAREFAIGDGSGKPRLMQVNAKLANPLTEEVPAGMDPQDFWLANSFTLEQRKADGRYDSIMLFNDQEAMVIADTNDQIIIQDHDFDGTLTDTEKDELNSQSQTIDDESNNEEEVSEETSPDVSELTDDELVESEEGEFANLDPVFTKSFIPNDEGRPISGVADLDNLQGYNSAYISFAKKFATAMVNSLNQNLKKTKTTWNNYPLSKVPEGKTHRKMTASLFEIVQDPEMNITRGRDYKDLAIVDQTTGEYHQELTELAALALADWMATAEPQKPYDLADRLEQLQVDITEIDDATWDDILYGLPPATVVDAVSKDILRMWGVQENNDAALRDLRGVTENLVKNMLEILNDSPRSNLIELTPISRTFDAEVGEVNTYTIRVDGLQKLQEQIRSMHEPRMPRNLKEGLFNIRRERFQVGEPITTVTDRQRKTKIDHSPMELQAKENLQSVPHYMSMGKAEFINALGIDGLYAGLGFRDDADDIKNPVLRKTVKGQNVQIETMIRELGEVTADLNDETTPVYFPVEIAAQGRHHDSGPNIQTNKLLRAIVTPTWDTFDFANETQTRGFWLGVAQGAEFGKIEKRNHDQLIEEVQEWVKTDTQFRGAVDLMKAWMKTGDLDAEAFAALGQWPTIQWFSAVEAVASYEFNKEAGNTEMRISLSAENDGLTNGAANMLVNFGQGEITAEDFENFNRIGYFVGQIGKTVNQFFENGGRDLYEGLADGVNDMLRRGLPNLKPREKAQTIALARFASQFGNIQEFVDDRGNRKYQLVRKSAKGPFTKLNYGSGIAGVGRGIGSEILISFYESVQGIGNQDLQSWFPAYPEIEQDMKELGLYIPKSFNDGAFVFNDESTEAFKKITTKILGKKFKESSQQQMGHKIKVLNDNLVFASNFQNEYVKLLFERNLQEIAAQRVAEGKMDFRVKGKQQIPVMASMSKRDYDRAMNDAQKWAPVFVSDEQTISIGGIEGGVSDLQLSNGRSKLLNQKSILPIPHEVGVKIIPMMTIGSGDAMMMNLIWSDPNFPKDAKGIFDGMDVPATKLFEYAEFINQKVLESWERDVLGMPVKNFEYFMSNADPDLMAQAFEITKSDNKNPDVILENAQQLMDALNKAYAENKARKAVLKTLPVSVDQMGGANVGFTRGEEEVGLTEINAKIRNRIEGKSDAPQEVNVEQHVTDAGAVLRSLRMNTDQKRVAGVIRPLLDGVTVVIGSRDQNQEYRNENFPDDGQALSSAKGQYDHDNRTVYLTTNSVDTVLHELVHAATYGRVLQHYDGTADSEAVSRLEDLMAEFLENDEINIPKVAEAKGAILRRQSEATPEGKAAALNEFMAYMLGNAPVREAGKSIITKTLENMAKRVLQLMRKLMGGIPANMFEQVIFNTRVLNDGPPQGPVNEDNGGDGNDGNGGETPAQPGGIFTDKWIEIVKNFQRENREGARAGRGRATKLKPYYQQSMEVLDELRQVGLVANPNARKSFSAIYIIMQAGINLHPQSRIRLNRLYNYIEENMTADMFGSSREANQEFQAIVNVLGERTATDGTSDAEAILFALSQTSAKFRHVLSQIPTPDGQADVEGGLNGWMQKATGSLMSSIMDTKFYDKPETAAELDAVADSLVDLEQNQEYVVLRKLQSGLDKADEVSRKALRFVAEKGQETNEKLQDETRSKITKAAGNFIEVSTGLLDKTRSANTSRLSKEWTHMGVAIPGMVPVRELVSEIIGTDVTNKEIVALQDQVNFAVSGMRQAYREDVPGILQNLFNEHPNAEQWSDLHEVLGQTDITRFINPRNMQRGFQMLEERTTRQNRIKELEQSLDANYVPYVAQDAKDKAQQLADYMLGNGAGTLPLMNAYAIMKNLDGNPLPDMELVIDELVSLYVIDQMDPSKVETIVQYWQNEPDAIRGLVTYIQGLNEYEDSKDGVTEVARLNAYKGYLPNFNANSNTQIKIDIASNKRYWEARGYTQLGVYEGDINSAVVRHYYVTNTAQQGPYSQGAMQNVAATYRGVDVNTGFSVMGNTSGIISDQGSIESIIEELNSAGFEQDNPKETLRPIFKEDNTVLGFERMINPDVIKQHMTRDQNLAVMLGAWAGRQVEERLAQDYNEAIIDQLDSIYQNRSTGTDDMFENIKRSNDPIYSESFSLWPQAAKNYADSKFDGQGPMVRKDMINLTVGYREPSIADMWSGKTRLPKEVQNFAVATATKFMGKEAMQRLVTGQTALQGVVSTAKDVIVIRSLLIPFLNSVSNTVQLSTIGVPLKTQKKLVRSKLAEIEEYLNNRTKIIKLENDLRLAANNPNQKRIVSGKIQALQDLNNRMSIAPMIEAGQFKQLSEGLTDLDVELTKGNIHDLMENIANKLPDRAADVAKLGLVSKSTKLYQVANRATQYGDFLAKAIYYDHLMGYDPKSGHFLNGMTHDQAIALVNEQFVNFSSQPGRVRSGMESNGLSWFLAFKLRILKIAMAHLRDNPARAIAINAALPDVGSPVQDNMLSVLLEGRLDYATGYEMLFDAPSLNPWVNLMNGDGL